jgi:hypothetical protein
MLNTLTGNKIKNDRETFVDNFDNEMGTEKKSTEKKVDDWIE